MPRNLVQLVTGWCRVLTAIPVGVRWWACLFDRTGSESVPHVTLVFSRWPGVGGSHVLRRVATSIPTLAVAVLIVTGVAHAGTAAPVKVMQDTLVCRKARPVMLFVQAVNDGKEASAIDYANRLVLNGECTIWQRGGMAAFDRDIQSISQRSLLAPGEPLAGRDGSVKLRSIGVVRISTRRGGRSVYAPGTDLNFMGYFMGHCPILGPMTEKCPVPEDKR